MFVNVCLFMYLYYLYFPHITSPSPYILMLCSVESQ